MRGATQQKQRSLKLRRSLPSLKRKAKANRPLLSNTVIKQRQEMKEQRWLKCYSAKWSFPSVKEKRAEKATDMMYTEIKLTDVVI